MLTISKTLTTSLKQNNTLPKLFHVFPEERKLSNTEQYVARNFLGYSFLNSAYTILYKDSAAFKVFVIESATPEKANAMLMEYLNAIPKETVTKLDPDKYQIRDPHNGVIGLRIFNQYICGVINCANSKTRDQYLNEVTANLLK